MRGVGWAGGSPAGSCQISPSSPGFVGRRCPRCASVSPTSWGEAGGLQAAARCPNPLQEPLRREEARQSKKRE